MDGLDEIWINFFFHFNIFLRIKERRSINMIERYLIKNNNIGIKIYKLMKQKKTTRV